MNGRMFVLCVATLVCLWPSSSDCRRWDASRRPTSAKAPAPASSAALGIRGYRRFHANDSLVGRSVPCTPHEKLCLSHNLVFYPPSNRCLSLVDAGRTNCDFVVDRAELQTGSGHVVGTCLPPRSDRCFGYRMAFDGLCYREESVRDVLCGCSPPPTPHPLGGVECRCSPGRPARVLQPKEDGRCVIPDLRSPHANHLPMLLLHPTVPFLHCSDVHCSVPLAKPSSTPPARCSDVQRKCFGEGMVSYGKHCFRLLETGLCEKNYVLVLSKNKTSGHMVICRHIRGDCPPGQIHMAFDNRCHDEREMKMIAPDGIQRNVFGDYIFVKEIKVIYKPVFSSGDCIVKIEILQLPVGRPNGNLIPPCGRDNKGKCLFEVYAELPVPFDDF